MENIDVVLQLNMLTGNGRKKSVRIKEAKQDVAGEDVKKLAQALVDNKIFKYDKDDTLASLDNAQVVVTTKNPVHLEDEEEA